MSKFVVIEGVDGAGTTTQAHGLQRALEARGVLVHLTREPSTGPVGAMLRQALTHRLVSPGGRPLGWETMALLFAADRMDHVDNEIAPALRQGKLVVCDRYDASSVAYQSLTSPGAPDEVMPWVRSINGRAPRPDLVIVLDVSPDVAEERRDTRGGTEELYDARELQRRLCGFYLELEHYMPEDNVVHIDGHQDVEAVAAKVAGHVFRLLVQP